MADRQAKIEELLRNIAMEQERDQRKGLVTLDAPILLRLDLIAELLLSLHDIAKGEPRG